MKHVELFLMNVETFECFNEFWGIVDDFEWMLKLFLLFFVRKEGKIEESQAKLLFIIFTVYTYF